MEKLPAPPNTTLTVQAKRLLGRYELPTIQRPTALCSARHPEQAVAFAALRAEAERLTAENACCRVSQLAVNGRDLMAAGVRPGPGLRQVLNVLLEAVITGQTPNEKRRAAGCGGPIFCVLTRERSCGSIILLF